ncbi:MAG: hypothetical protein GWN29_12300, partial [Gammaproteobacteria bacterium]|nr:hypothetical protein [Gammaproteobacteria bacterium]
RAEAQSVAETIEAAADALGMVRTVARRMDSINAVQFSGTGTLRQPESARRWSEREITSATIGMSYYVPALRWDMTVRAADGSDMRTVEVMREDRAWNEVTPGVAPTDAPGQADERAWQIWITPHGIIRAAVDAAAADPSSVSVGSQRGQTTLSVAVNGVPFTAVLDDNNRPERVTATIDHPVLGSTELVATYTDYIDWQILDVYFPSRIVHTLDGETALDLTVTEFFQNPYVVFPTPEQLARRSQ